MIKVLYIFIMLVIGHVTYKADVMSNFTPNLQNNQQRYIYKNYNDDELSYRLQYRDKQVVQNPLSPPERRVEKQQYPVVNFYERTRGTPDDYQMIGLLYDSLNEKDKKYQLYGRRIYPGSYEWEYYVRGADAGGLEFKFPIELDNKREIRDNDQLTLPFDGNVYTAKIYNLNQPRYNPFVI
jgi:hypothetical protein